MKNRAIITSVCLLGAAALTVLLKNRATGHGDSHAERAANGPNSSSTAGRGGLEAPVAGAVNHRRPGRPAGSDSRPTDDAAIIARQVMPRLLDVTRKTIEANISTDQMALNAAERGKNPWLYQRLGLGKDKEEQALAIVRKKDACEQRAMEAASLTNEDEVAFNGLKPYQDELDAKLKEVLGNQYETYRKLGETYEQITRGNARLPEDQQLSDDQAHHLADLMNDVYAKSAQGVSTPPGEEEDYDDLMKRVAADEMKIRQGSASFLTPEQLNAVINAPDQPGKAPAPP